MPRTSRPQLRSQQNPAPMASAVAFSESVRRVVALARREQLRPPVFRSPPSLQGVDRSIRRRRSGAVTISIRREGRPLAAVQADVIEGVIAANRLSGAAADRFRHRAWSLLGSGDHSTAPFGGAKVA